MRTTASLFVVASIILAWFAVCAGADPLTVNLHFDSAGLGFQPQTGGDSVTYSRITLADCHETTTDEGKPELPAKTIRILLPPGAAVDSLSAAPRSQEVHSTPQSPYPKQPPEPTSIDHPVIP
ncbi:MAG: hypothetical protein ACP5R5_11140, partial [Armatimonadota bacterium]